MPIEVTCSSCQRRLRLPEKAAGKRIKCPKCSGVISVPKGAQTNQADTTEWTPAALNPTAEAPKPESYAPRNVIKRPTPASRPVSLEESPGWYVKVGEDTEELGPVPRAKLDAWAAGGCLGEDSQVLLEGDDQWQWATDLFPQLEDQQPTAAIDDSDEETGTEKEVSAEKEADVDKGPSPKSRITAGTLGVFLGGLGLHRFYLGYTLIGILQVVVTLFTCVGLWWGVIEGILILMGKFTKDGQGRTLVDENDPAR